MHSLLLVATCAGQVSAPEATAVKKALSCFSPHFSDVHEKMLLWTALNLIPLCSQKRLGSPGLMPQLWLTCRLVAMSQERPYSYSEAVPPFAGCGRASILVCQHISAMCDGRTSNIYLCLLFKIQWYVFLSHCVFHVALWPSVCFLCCFFPVSLCGPPWPLSAQQAGKTSWAGRTLP